MFLTHGIFESAYCRDVEMHEAIIRRKPFVLLSCTKGQSAFRSSAEECEKLESSFRPFAAHLCSTCTRHDWSLNITTRAKILEEVENGYVHRFSNAEKLHQSWVLWKGGGQQTKLKTAPACTCTCMLADSNKTLACSIVALGVGLGLGFFLF